MKKSNPITQVAIRLAILLSILTLTNSYRAYAQGNNNEQPERARIKVAISGVPGDEPDGSIEAVAIDHKLTLPVSNPGGAGAAPPSFALTITKRIDKATPKLFGLAASGHAVSRVTITWTRFNPTNNRDEAYYTITLTNVEISALKQRPVSATAPESKFSAEYEDVSFTFDRIEWSYQLPNQGAVRDGYDLRANRRY